MSTNGQMSAQQNCDNFLDLREEKEAKLLETINTELCFAIVYVYFVCWYLTFGTNFVNS